MIGKAPAVRMNDEIAAGISHSLEVAIRFADWAASMGDRLTADAIQKKYGCSRSTSYRWLNAYNAARARYDIKEAA